MRAPPTYTHHHPARLHLEGLPARTPPWSLRSLHGPPRTPLSGTKDRDSVFRRPCSPRQSRLGAPRPSWGPLPLGAQGVSRWRLWAWRCFPWPGGQSREWPGGKTHCSVTPAGPSARAQGFHVSCVALPTQGAQTLARPFEQASGSACGPQGHPRASAATGQQGVGHWCWAKG